LESLSAEVRPITPALVMCEQTLVGEAWIVMTDDHGGETYPTTTAWGLAVIIPARVLFFCLWVEAL
jgi:hypothetical protein